MNATQEKQQNQVKEIFALWKHEGKEGKQDYFTGKSRTDVNLVAFYNTNKKNPNEPDLRIYVKTEDGKIGDEICSLWCKLSKNDKKYLSGKLTNQDVYLRGFFTNDKDGKRPYIRVYLQTELDKANESKQVEVKKEEPKKESKPKKETPLF